MGGNQRLWRYISAGVGFTCGILDNFTATCWGLEEKGRVSGANIYKHMKFSVVSTGLDHACGIDLFNTLVCWGGDNAGTPSAYAVPPPLPPGSSGWIGVKAGRQISCAISTELQLVCFGTAQPGGLPTSPGSSTYLG